jgi:cytochrome P450
VPESYVVTAHRTVRTVLQSDDFTVEHPFRASRLTLGPTILDTDGPVHTRAKKILGALLSPANVRLYQDRVIRPVIRDAWARLTGRHVDIVQELARPIPSRVIFDVLGLPSERALDVYERDIGPIAEYIGDNRSGHQRVQEACDRLIAFVEAHTGTAGRPTELGLDQVLDAYAAEGRKRQEAISAILLLLAAGTETTIAGIANLFYFIGEYPASWQAVLDGELTTRIFVEESLRLGVPLGKTVRFAKCETVLDPDTTSARGAVVELRLDEANRDERTLACPHAWSPEAGRGVGVAFGYGRHACLGKGLAIAELIEVGETLLDARFDPARIGERPAIAGTTFRRPPALWVHA